MRRLSELKRDRAGRGATDREYDRMRRRKANPHDRMRHLMQWQKVRAMKLAQDPLCERCKSTGRIIGASEVHHIRPLRSHPELAYDLSNLLSLCVPCHRQIDADLNREGS